MTLPTGVGIYADPKRCWANSNEVTKTDFYGVPYCCSRKPATPIDLCIPHYREIVDSDYLTHADAWAAWQALYESGCGPEIDGSEVAWPTVFVEEVWSAASAASTADSLSSTFDVGVTA